MSCTFSFDYSIPSCLCFPSIWRHKQVSSYRSLLFLTQAFSLTAFSTNTNSAATAVVTACRSNFSASGLTPVQPKILVHLSSISWLMFNCQNKLNTYKTQLWTSSPKTSSICIKLSSELLLPIFSILHLHPQSLWTILAFYLSVMLLPRHHPQLGFLLLLMPSDLDNSQMLKNHSAEHIIQI